MRVAVAEDNPVYLRGIVEYITDFGVEVVGTADSREKILDLAKTCEPDVVILDIALQSSRDAGLVAAEMLRREYPSMGILILSEYAEAEYAIRLLDPDPRGKGYWIKNHVADVGILQDALSRISIGEYSLDPEIIRTLTEAKRCTLKLGSRSRLSSREWEVMRLMGEGYNNRSIANTLSISLKTIESHVANIFKKLGIESDPSYDKRVLAVLEYLRDPPGADFNG